MLLGRVSLSRFVQYENTESSSFTPSGMLTYLRFVHPLKAALSIDMMLFGMFMLTRFVQSLNNELEMDVIELGRLTCFRLMQEENAPEPI